MPEVTPPDDRDYAVPNENLIRLDPYRWVILGQALAKAPVTGGAAPVEQAAFRQQKRPGADRRDSPDARGHSPNPIRQHRIAQDRIDIRGTSNQQGIDAVRNLAVRAVGRKS